MHSESPLLLEIENPIRYIGSWINPVMKDSEKVKPVLPCASRMFMKEACSKVDQPQYLVYGQISYTRTCIHCTF